MFAAVLDDGIRSALVERAKKRREGLASEGIQNRHYQTNTILEEVGKDQVNGRTMLLVAWQREGEPAPSVVHTGEYHDEFLRSQDGWRLARRDILVDHD